MITEHINNMSALQADVQSDLNEHHQAEIIEYDTLVIDLEMIDATTPDYAEIAARCERIAQIFRSAASRQTKGIRL